MSNAIGKAFEAHGEAIGQASRRLAEELRHRGELQSYDDAIDQWKALTVKLGQKIEALEAKIHAMAGENKELDARRSGLKAQRNAVLGELREVSPEHPFSKKNEDGQCPGLNEIYDQAYNEIMQAPAS